MRRKPAQKRSRRRAQSNSTPRPTRIKTILVPIDFSPSSLAPIEWAKFIARKTKAQIHFVHVHDFAFPIPASILPPIVDSEKEIEQRLHRDLKAIASDGNVPKSTCHIRIGRTFHQICKLAEEIRADLIAISTHGRTGWDRVLLGSTSERIIRHAPCPILVVRQTRASKKKQPRIDTVLAPVDFSDCSAKGLNYAIGFTQLFGGHLVLLNTFQIHHDLPSAVIYSESRLVRWAREIAEAHMRDLVEATDFDGVKFETEIKKGPTARTIDRYGHEIEADLIVAATHGWSGLPHVLMGSTAEQIVRYAKSPVLVVPTHKRIMAKMLRASAGGRRS